MKKTFVGVGLIFALAGIGNAQKADSKASISSKNQTSVSKNAQQLDLQSETQLSAQLESALDAKKARVGDQVVLKTSKAIKQNGRVVVEKGSRLIGQITEVRQKSQNSAASKIGILFDKLDQGGRQIPINAVITSITQVNTRASIDDTADAEISGSSSTQAQAGSSSGGLLGGVGNTVGGLTKATARTVGNTTNAVGQTLGKTTQAAGNTLRGIQISQSTEASAEGSSVLSLQGDNLRLAKGTTFNLNLSQSASVNN